MIVAVCCVLAMGLVLTVRPGMAKNRPMDREVIRRIQRCADQARREQLLPYE